MSYDFYQRIWDRANTLKAGGKSGGEALREAFMGEISFCEIRMPNHKFQRLARMVKILLSALDKEM